MFGLDMASPGIMTRAPRKVHEPLISTGMFIRLFVVGLLMAAMALYLFHVGKVTYGSMQTGQTMALVSLSLMNIFLAWNLRFPSDTAFQAATFSNARLVYIYLWVVFGAFLMTESRLFQDIFGTAPLSPYQWLLCLIPGLIILAAGEIFKAVLRSRDRKSPVPR
jgi:Ca2+-transporting ATPase